MKIIHLCLSSFYIDGYNYQENALPRQNKADGHDVRIVASTFTFMSNIKCGFVQPSSYINDDGIPVTRLPYKKCISRTIESKIRSYSGVYSILESFSPDVIFFHGASAYELLTVAKYKKKNMHVKLYVDNHADMNNSATGLISRIFLHKIFYKAIIHKALPYIDKIFNLSIECGDFLKEVYGIEEKKLEFYPLGGNIIEGYQYSQIRNRKRSELSLSDDNILLVHSGKMDGQKKTVDILLALKQIKSKRLRLVLLGSISADLENDILKLINEDDRVQFLGWKNTDQLIEYLCAADIYVQPGSQSATMQNAICCGCPLILYPHKSHKPYLRDNGFFVESRQDLIDCFQLIESNPMILNEMSISSYSIAHELLDYKQLAKRVYI